MFKLKIPKFSQNKDVSNLADNIPLPFHINIELTTACNYLCQYCAVSASSYRANKIKKEEAFKIIDDLESIKFSTGVIQLSGHGESTVLPWFEDLIIYIRKKLPNVSISFHTNGSYLDKLTKTIVDYNVDNISISIDAATPEIFDPIRGEGSFKQLMKGLNSLHQYKLKQNSNKPDLCFVATLMKTNVFELEKIVELAHKFNVNHVITNPLTPYLELGTEDFTLNSLNEQERSKVYDLVSKTKKLAEVKGIEFKILNEDPFNEPITEWHLQKEKQEDNQNENDKIENSSATDDLEQVPTDSATDTQEQASPNIPKKQYRLCSDPWRNMFINAKTSFDTCCFRHDDVTETLKNHSLYEIWYNSEGLNKVRNDLLQGNLDEICAGCTLRPISDQPPQIPDKWTQ